MSLCCSLLDGFITLHIQWKTKMLSFFRHTLGCFAWWWTPIKCCQSTLRRSLKCTKAKSATRFLPISTPSLTTLTETWCKVRPGLLDIDKFSSLYKISMFGFHNSHCLETSNSSASQKHFYFTNWQQNSVGSPYTSALFECHSCLLKWSVTAHISRSVSGVRSACTHVSAGHTSNAILTLLNFQTI